MLLRMRTFSFSGGWARGATAQAAYAFTPLPLRRGLSDVLKADRPILPDGADVQVRRRGWWWWWWP
jgi:hypothetical protein